MVRETWALSDVVKTCIPVEGGMEGLGLPGLGWGDLSNLGGCINIGDLGS